MKLSKDLQLSLLSLLPAPKAHLPTAGNLQILDGSTHSIPTHPHQEFYTFSGILASSASHHSSCASFPGQAQHPCPSCHSPLSVALLLLWKVLEQRNLNKGGREKGGGEGRGQAGFMSPETSVHHGEKNMMENSRAAITATRKQWGQACSFDFSPIRTPSF